jgi:acyl-CoA thioester hydrolase
LPAELGPPEGVTVSRVPIRIRFAETDLMGIVHHANYLLYFEEARVEYLSRRGLFYTEWMARGLHLPVVDARLRYRSAAVFHDLVEVECWIAESSRVAVRFDYRIFRGAELLAEGYTTLACVDDKRVPRRIPPEILEQVLGPEKV